MRSFACIFLLRLRVSVRACKHISARQLSASATTVSPLVSPRSSQNFLFISSAAARSQPRPTPGFHLRDSETPHRGANHVSSLSALRHAASTVFWCSRLVFETASSGSLIKISQDSAKQRMQLLLFRTPFVTPKVTPCPVISS